MELKKYPKKAHWKGKHHSLESREKMKGRTPWNKGMRTSLEIRKKLSELKRGSKHPNWKGGITPIRKAIQSSLEYRLWRTAVFERDNYTCVWCGVRGAYLEADHIKPFALFPELRFAIDNGRTLCKPCHETADTYKGRINRKIIWNSLQPKKR